MKKLMFALCAFSLLAGSSPSLAKAPQCRDKSGKFIKCPQKPVKPKQCRDKSGKFIKCK
jgi:hypothetical protein